MVGDRIEWVGDCPEEFASGRSVAVQILVPDVAIERANANGTAPIAGPEGGFRFKSVSSIADAEPWTEEKGRRMAAALDRIAASGELRDVDGVAWQREIRKDRPQPGRD